MATQSSRFYFSVSWRNLWRHRRRTLITAAAMGLGIAMCMASIVLQDGMYAQMFDVMVTDSLGHVQLHHPDYPAKKRAHDTLKDDVVAPLEDLDGVGRILELLGGEPGHGEQHAQGLAAVAVGRLEELVDAKGHGYSYEMAGRRRSHCSSRRVQIDRRL